jgi:hypothetical protein
MKSYGAEIQLSKQAAGWYDPTGSEALLSPAKMHTRTSGKPVGVKRANCSHIATDNPHEFQLFLSEKKLKFSCFST